MDTSTWSLGEKAIIVLPVSLFAGWLYLLFTSAANLVRTRRLVRQCAETMEWLSRSDLAGEPSPADQGSAWQPLDSHPLEKAAPPEDSFGFTGFCELNGLSPDSPLEQHLRTIYQAGCENRRLDATGLLQMTENRLLGVNQYLKSVAASFVVFGIAGTLVVLSASVSQLQPVLVAAPSLAAASLTTLLAGLGQVFIPGLLGALLTALSVLGLSLYTRFACQPLLADLAYYTINTWIPALCPTAEAERGAVIRQTGQEFRSVVSSSAEAFAASLANWSGQFGEQMEKASTLLAAMVPHLQTFNQATGRLQESMENIGRHDEQLLGLQAKLHADFQALKADIGSGANGIVQLQTQLNRSYHEYQAVMQQIAGTFGQLHELHLATAALAKTAEASYVKTTEQSRESMEAWQAPLLDALNDNFSLITRTMARDLGQIINRFSSLETPLEQSARSIAQVFGSLSMSYDNLASLIQEAIVESNNRVIDEALAGNRQIAEHLTALVGQNQAIVTRLEQLFPSAEAAPETADPLTVEAHPGPAAASSRPKKSLQLTAERTPSIIAGLYKYFQWRALP